VKNVQYLFNLFEGGLILIGLRNIYNKDLDLGWDLMDAAGTGQNTRKTVAIIVGGAAGVGFLVIFLLFARGLIKKREGMLFCTSKNIIGLDNYTLHFTGYDLFCSFNYFVQIFKRKRGVLKRRQTPFFEVDSFYNFISFCREMTFRGGPILMKKKIG
jgi:hypothetical protein